MPVNPGIAYQLAEDEFHKARTTQEKIKALEKMYSTVPKHKSSEKLQQQIKKKLSKFKQLSVAEQKKKGGSYQTFKKEGAATVVVVGTTNSGKSTILNNLTNTHTKVADYPFTTKKPVVGILNYKGIKIQFVEIPAIVKDFYNTQQGPFYLSIIKQSDLILLMFNNPKEKQFLDNELAKIDVPLLIVNNIENIEDKIWKKLPIIKVFSKMPGKEADFPPLSLEKGSNVNDMAAKIHKDFIKNFKFARVWGKSVKHQGQRVSLNHVLEDDDVVEVHSK